ncbi:MAG: isochorismatase family protein [Pseudomonadota bacterium]
MKEKVKWLKEALSDEEREILRRGGWGKQRGLGVCPCLMVIDAQYNYIGQDAPILEQMERWPSGCGTKAWAAVPRIDSLLEAARGNNYPVIYTRQVQKNIAIREKFDGFGTKIERRSEDMVDGAKGTEIIEELSPRDGDLVIDKSYASAFFATPLISFLIKMQIDTILVIGGTTSGCVRSTAVDAAARNYNVGIVMDCVFDRLEYSHRAALLDMWMKYADVITSEEALAYLENSNFTAV